MIVGKKSIKRKKIDGNMITAILNYQKRFKVIILPDDKIYREW